MKRLGYILCLLFTIFALAGCTSKEEIKNSTAAPDTVSGAVVGSEAVAESKEEIAAGNTEKENTNTTAELTEKALTEIRALGESPDDNYRTWYEIFVYSFCDSDGDGIGDFNGITSKLDYLEELGINGIWLMPIHPSTSYHKYNVSDYYAVDPEYGTMEDFEKFMAECEKCDIRVILDLVVNHSGSENVWFKEAVSYLQNLEDGKEPDVSECKYLDYYFFTKEQESGYREVEGTDWYYEARFNYDMPDLNLHSEALRAEITEIMKFWLDKGVAGFRLDAAKEFYSGQVDKNIEVLNWIQETAETLKPDVYLVAEVWESFLQIAEYYKSGITSVFNFAFGNADGKIISVLRGAGKEDRVTSYATALEKADAAYAASNPEYIDAPFLSNHDVGRIAGFCTLHEQKTKLAGAMNLFMSGSAFIYYGEEIGMVGSGNDPSKRAPMYWNDARDNGTTNPPPECELPDEYPFGSLEQQAGDDDSVYNYYRQAIAIRNAIPAISHGKTTAETELNKGCVSAFRKTSELGDCIVLMNIQEDAASVDLSAYSDWKMAAGLSADGNPVSLEGASLNLPAYGTAVLVPAE